LAHDNLTSLLEALIAIDSVNPSLVPGGAGEAAMARFVTDWCAARGIPAEIDDAAPGRSSVIARVKGSGGGRSVVLNSHVDTVGVAGMPHPFRAYVENGRMFGRGSYDMKGSLAACMLAVADVRAEGLKGDVILAAVADEEHASIGVQSVLQHIKADAAIVTEPTALDMCVAHKGFSWHEITTSGRAAHGSRPDLGIDAIAHMGRVLNHLEALQAELNRRTPHPLLGNGSVHASLISGGQELSSYPEKCTVQIERRTLPHETRETVEGEFNAILNNLASEDQQFQAHFETTLVRPPFSVSEDEFIVKTLRDQAIGVLGRAPKMIGVPFWMDAAFFAGAGIPTVNIGPDGAGAHSTEEWVDLDSVEKCREILARTVRVFCA
jgi:acetylornithine deacetylase